jgi:S1-C subfamily serine protease
VLVNQGNSGGPVYSLRDGSVVGVVRSLMVEERGMSFASPVNTLRRLLGR